MNQSKEQPIKSREEILDKYYDSDTMAYISKEAALLAMEEYKNQFIQGGSIKGWVKASEHLPEDKRHLEQLPIQVVVKWLHHGEFQRIDLMTLNQLADRVKAIDDPDYYEYLDETPIDSGEERLLDLLVWYQGKGDQYRERTELTDCVKDYLALKRKIKPERNPSLLSREQKVQVSVATEADQGGDAGNKKLNL